MTKIVNKKKKIRTKNDIAFVVMVVVAVLVILGTGTYAYYQTTIAGNVNGTIAQWSFKANNQTETFNLDFGSLYPGKTGTYNLELSAEDSNLDVYYEFIIHEEWQLTGNLFFDSNYTMGPSYDGDYYVGMYGVIPAGQKVTIPLYYNWPYGEYGNDNNNYADGDLISTNISIIGKQYTSYSGSIPMNLFNLTLVSSNSTFNNNVIPVACLSGEFGYGCSGDPFTFLPISETSGYIILF